MTGSAPVKFTRCTRVKILVLLVLLETEIGKPLSIEIIEEIVQSPKMAARTPLFAHFFPCPNGSSMIGDTVILCGTSSRPTEYSGPRS